MKKRINRRKEFYQSRLQQSFPFRDTLINYIVKNPSSPKLYQKLIKTCKYFFAANPILVVKNFKLEIQDDDECNEIEIDAECWGEPNINTISTFLLKIFKCHAKKCVFDYLGDVSIKDFLFLTPKCKVISLCCFTVIDDDGSTVTLEKIVEVLPRIKAFYYYFYAVDASKIVSTGTVEKLLQVPHISKICKFFLDDVPESFDIERFFAYIKVRY
uniref:Uncharacterized protein n=1 Tax=Panagrolaimus superbus TaxID=310955 RepID=A0A914YTW3_9BILA